MRVCRRLQEERAGDAGSRRSEWRRACGARRPNRLDAAGRGRRRAASYQFALYLDGFRTGTHRRELHARGGDGVRLQCHAAHLHSRHAHPRACVVRRRWRDDRRERAIGGVACHRRHDVELLRAVQARRHRRAGAIESGAGCRRAAASIRSRVRAGWIDLRRRAWRRGAADSRWRARRHAGARSLWRSARPEGGFWRSRWIRPSTRTG